MTYFQRAIKGTLLPVLVLLASVIAHAEDIDIFTGAEDADEVGLPNVIFVLDNTSNWSRQSQQWPGGLAQGQSEVRAITNALEDQIGKINVGLVEFTVTTAEGGDANKNGAYVRFDLQPLTGSGGDNPTGSFAAFHSGCHCTDRVNPGAPCT